MRPLTLLLAIFAVLMLAACGGRSPATVTASPTATASATATAVPTAPSTGTPAGGGSAGAVRVDTVRLLQLESFPVQVRLSVAGMLPTPCHVLRWTVADDGRAIDVALTAQAPAGAVCAQVLQPFTITIPLGAFASGSREVRLNGAPVGRFDLGPATPVPTAAPSPAASGPARLRVGDTLAGPGDWTLRLLRVERDSRCPVNASCPRAGDATVVLAAAHGDAPGAELAITVAPDAGAASLDGLAVRVLRLEPAPRAATPIAPGDYLATLLVEASAARSAGLLGVVTVGPTCPVVRADQPCPDRPLAATLVVADARGREATRVRSGDDGFYRAALPPGAYRVTPLSPGGAILPAAPPFDVAIGTGTWTVTDVAYDSGIR